MHYLEDDIELLETLPPELKAQCCEMRDIDAKIESIYDAKSKRYILEGLAQIRESSREFFDVIDNLTPEEREARYQKIKADYSLIRELSEEKVHIAEFLHAMMEKYGDRVSKDLAEFKSELEAESPGVTTQIEQEFFDKERALIASRKEKFYIGTSSEDFNIDDDVLLEDKFLPSTSRMNGHRSLDGISKGLSTPDLLSTTSMRSRSSTANSLENMPPPKRRLTTKQFEHAPKSISSSTSLEKYERSNSSSASTTPKAQSPAPSSRRYPPNALSFHLSDGTFPGSVASTSQQYLSHSHISSTASPLPSFVSTQESRHGRPRKLTPRVQQMIKDGEGRRIGRPPGPFNQIGLPISPTPTGAFTNNRRFTYSETEEDIGDEAEDEEEEGDEDNRTWCFCNRETFGDMIACDNKNCRYEWFHYGCVGISAPPKGKWYCSECQQLLDTRRSASVEKR